MSVAKVRSRIAGALGVGIANLPSDRYAANVKIERDSPDAGVRLLKISIPGRPPYWRVETRDKGSTSGAWVEESTSPIETSAVHWFEDTVARRLAKTDPS